MEDKESIALAGVIVAGAGVLVTWIKHRHDVRKQTEESMPRPAKPYLGMQHTVTFSAFTQEHALRLDISNRDERPIAIKEVYWYVKSFKTSWPLSYRRLALPNDIELPQHKLETADLMQFEVDIDNIFVPLLGSRQFSLLENIVAVIGLEAGIVLTTGEEVRVCTPRRFRAFLAGRLIRPSWFATLVAFFVRLQS